MPSLAVKDKDPFHWVWSLGMIRKAESDHHKMALAHLYFKVPLRTCGERFGLGKDAAARAAAAFKEGRELGANGRPRYFTKEEEKQIEQYVIDQTDKNESLRPTELIDIVRDIFREYVR